MLVFVLSLMAGYFTPKAEPYMEKMIKIAGFADMPLAPGEMRLITFVKLLGAVALFGAIFGYVDNALIVIIGGSLGLFGERMFRIFYQKYEEFRAKQDAKND